MSDIICKYSWNNKWEVLENVLFSVLVHTIEITPQKAPISGTNTGLI